MKNRGKRWLGWVLALAMVVAAPVPVRAAGEQPPQDVKVKSLKVGNGHGLALLQDGSLWVWGRNGNGQLGTGTLLDSPLTRLETIDNVVSIGSGILNSMAMKNDGTVWGWGNNGIGQLSVRPSTDTHKISVPVQIKGLRSTTMFIGSLNNIYALKGDGTVWVLGGNYKGTLGLGTQNDAASTDMPEQITGLKDIVSIASCYRTAFAVKRDGSVWAWGENTFGAVGDGTKTDRYTPVQLRGINNVKSVSGGQYFNLALKNDGTVWAWGDNRSGQLGDRSSTEKLLPAQVQGLSNVISVAAGYNHSLAVLADGTVWAWGSNSAGQLGDGTTVDSATPVKVEGLANVVSVHSSNNQSFAIKSDGSAWAWGSNKNNGLGLPMELYPDIVTTPKPIWGPHEEQVDLTALEERIARAEALDQDNYTEDSWTALADKLAQAKALVDSAPQTQQPVDEMAAQLQAALDGLVILENRIIGLDMDAYEGLIDQENNTITFAIPEGELENGRYVGSIARLEAGRDTVIFQVAGDDSEHSRQEGDLAGFASGDIVYVTDDKVYTLQIDRIWDPSTSGIQKLTLDEFPSVIDHGAGTISFAIPRNRMDNGKVLGEITELEADNGDTVVFKIGGDDTEYPRRQGELAAFGSGDQVFVAGGRVYTIVIEIVDASETVYTHESPEIQWFRAWSVNANNPAERIANADSAHAELAFHGTSVVYIGTKNANRGKVDIYINDQYEATVDAYAASLTPGQELFRREGLPAGTNRIRIVRSADRNPAATNGFVSLEAFVVA